VQLVGDAERVLAPDGDQGVDPEGLEARPAPFDTIVDLVRIRP
jgi:hypothetical protein